MVGVSFYFPKRKTIDEGSQNELAASKRSQSKMMYADVIVVLNWLWSIPNFLLFGEKGNLDFYKIHGGLRVGLHRYEFVIHVLTTNMKRRSKHDFPTNRQSLVGMDLMPKFHLYT